MRADRTRAAYSDAEGRDGIRTERVRTGRTVRAERAVIRRGERQCIGAIKAGGLDERGANPSCIRFLERRGHRYVRLAAVMVVTPNGCVSTTSRRLMARRAVRLDGRFVARERAVDARRRGEGDQQRHQNTANTQPHNVLSIHPPSVRRATAKLMGWTISTAPAVSSTNEPVDRAGADCLSGNLEREWTGSGFRNLADCRPDSRVADGSWQRAAAVVCVEARRHSELG